MMNQSAGLISTEPGFSRIFSICCIVTRDDEYEEMRSSFYQHGFDGHDVEWLVADNRNGNQFDAYAAIRRFLFEAQAQYVILVHQDVRCQDSKQNLMSALADLDAKKPLWAVCGNAGGYGYKRVARYLNDHGKEHYDANLPKRVLSLDENWLLIRNGKGITVSSDVGDFHFYGTDICQVADFLGYESYVIPFKVLHLSSGNLSAMYAQQPRFLKAYARKLRSRFIQTTCTKFMLRGGSACSSMMNHPVIFFWIKFFQRIKQLFY